MADRSAISVPESLAEAFSRLRKNAYYFHVNYLIVIAVVLAAAHITLPLTFLQASLAGACIFLYVVRPTKQQLVILGRAVTDCEALFLLSMATFAVALLTSVVSVVASAVTVGVGLVFAHGAFRVPEDLFLEQDESWPWAFGLFPFVGDAGPASSVGVLVGPTMV